jgi:hypothetical protein
MLIRPRSLESTAVAVNLAVTKAEIEPTQDASAAPRKRF